ncbi:hypothetical protein B0E53_03987 [Micromonospora sp. MH33]|uniref:hypothetical protein n=1 Tax=Micromonospora sp. MH33 TaxID=1945509 RepID=UPI000D2E08CC|nr:hypothetical protein [Micromonospora sp. MH33]PSK64082.1 hypothetical protein B0E53_03987 [Micromonospora sp. MH33]
MTEFALYVAVLRAVAVLAPLSNRLVDHLRLPAPALFLFAAVTHRLCQIRDLGSLCPPHT